MRDLQPDLAARLQSGATHLCRCWRVTRRDGVTFGFTDHDQDLQLDGLVYQASSGMDASALQSSTGMSVDNAQAAGALSSAAVSEPDIRGGKFDRARIDHWLVDWQRPTLRVLLFRGYFGEVRRADGAFEVELRGEAELLNVPVGRSILRRCDRVLGDNKCRVDLSSEKYSTEAVVEKRSGKARLTAAVLGAYPAGWFENGTVTWLSGANAGETSVVKTDISTADGQRILDLWQQPGLEVQPSDRFRIAAGCDKHPGTCRKKFDNFLNFRGFPHLPGEDWVTAYPKDGAIHDGGSQQL